MKSHQTAAFPALSQSRDWSASQMTGSGTGLETWAWPSHQLTACHKRYWEGVVASGPLTTGFGDRIFSLRGRTMSFVGVKPLWPRFTPRLGELIASSLGVSIGAVCGVLDWELGFCLARWVLRILP